MALEPLHSLYPATSPCTILYPTSFSHPPATGTVYCTDEISNTITITIPLTHTTLALDCRTFSLTHIDLPPTPTPTPHATKIRLIIDVTNTRNLTDQDVIATFPPDQRSLSEKELKEREDHQNKIAIDKLRHTNPKAGPVGMRVFEKLLKACGDVKWTREPSGNAKDPAVNIIIDDKILVMEPYDPATGVVIKDMDKLSKVERVKQEENQNRVRKIVNDAKEGLEKEQQK